MPLTYLLKNRYSLERQGGLSPIKKGFWLIKQNRPCRLKSPLSKDETRRDGSNPFIVILSLHHYSFCETMSQVLLS